jgi:hypothetical protein
VLSVCVVPLLCLSVVLVPPVTSVPVTIPISAERATQHIRIPRPKNAVRTREGPSGKTRNTEQTTKQHEKQTRNWIGEQLEDFCCFRQQLDHQVGLIMKPSLCHFFEQPDESTSRPDTHRNHTLATQTKTRAET